MRPRLKQDEIYEAVKSDIIAQRLPVGAQVLNGIALAEKFDVSHLTARRAVKRLAQEGYIELINGRGAFVSSRRPGWERQANLLVLLPEYSVEGSPTLCVLPEFERICYENPVSITRIPLEWLRRADPVATVKNLKARNYTGVLLAAACYLGKEEELEILRNLEIPVLLPFASRTDAVLTGFATMQPDWKKAWCDGLRHLQNQGFRKIALLLSSDFRLPIFSREEHLKRLEEYGATSAFPRIEYASSEENSVIGALEKLLSAPELPDAIYCGCDNYAVRVIRHLEKRRINVPEKIAVLGFSGMPAARILSPTLSTVDFEYDRIGAQAAEILLHPDAWWNQPDGKTPEIRTGHTLTLRGSAEINKK